MMHRRQTGMTLIELMVVVVIIAILASIAYPSYRQYAIRANRTEAKTELLQLTQTLEKCYTRSHSYEACIADAEYSTPSGNYKITVDVEEDGQSYLLSAEPQSGQGDDTKCGTLTLSNTGVKKERGSETLDPVKKCW